MHLGPRPVGQQVEGEPGFLILLDLEPLPPGLVLGEAGPAHATLKREHQRLGINCKGAGYFRDAAQVCQGPDRMDGPVLVEFHEFNLFDTGTVAAS